MSPLRVWQSVVWPTLAFGLAEVGLSLESAKSLRAWYAFKIRSVLNKPAHVTHMTTSELYEMYSIEDPVVKLERLQANRFSHLTAQHSLSPSVVCTSEAVQHSQHQLQSLRHFRQKQETAVVEGTPVVSCQDCDRTFTSEQGSRLHRAKQHPDSVERYVPERFDRAKHSVDGLPICRACGAQFKQWPGLLSHLLSGACPKPQALKDLDASTDSSTLPSHLESLARAVAEAPRHQLPKIARNQDSSALLSQCLQCGLWTPGYTKLKSHVRKVHAQLWAACQEQVSKTRGSFATHTPKGLKCPFCGMQVHNKNQHCS